MILLWCFENTFTLIVLWDIEQIVLNYLKMKILLSIFGMLHLTAQHVGGHIGLLRMIEHLTIIILDHFKPSTLSHVQTRLIHKIYQTLVLHVDDTSVSMGYPHGLFPRMPWPTSRVLQLIAMGYPNGLSFKCDGLPHGITSKCHGLPPWSFIQMQWLTPRVFHESIIKTTSILYTTI